MPTTRYAPATANAAPNAWRAYTRYPVMIGAAIPEIWFEKFRMPPTRPTLPRGAINDGSDHPTGDAADRPPIESVIQASAWKAECEPAQPRMPRPMAVPPTSTV